MKTFLILALGAGLTLAANPVPAMDGELGAGVDPQMPRGIHVRAQAENKGVRDPAVKEDKKGRDHCEETVKPTKAGRTDASLCKCVR